MKKMQKVRFAIAGCGRIAPYHVRAIKAQKNAELVAVCDVSKERAEKLAKESKCDYTTSYEELLKRKDIDVVSICTPHNLHAQMTIAAANAKKHVITEKPMALSLEDADAMINACKKNKVKLFVIKQNRYNLPLIKLKDAIAQGRFGKIFLGKASVLWSRSQAYYDQDAWRGTIKGEGGILLQQAAHYVDILRWMLGEVESVVGKTATMTHKIEADDTAVAFLKCRNGAFGSIEATTCVFGKDMEGSITIFGEHGSAKIGGIALNKVEMWEFKEERKEDKEIRKLDTNPPDVYGFGHFYFMKEVIECLLENKDHSIDGKDARETLKLILAIQQSQGKEVKL